MSDTFRSMEMDEAQKYEALTLRGFYRGLELEILEKVPEGRRRSLALTALEQSCMWAVSAMAKDGKEG